MSSKFKLSALATALTLGLATFSTGVYANSDETDTVVTDQNQSQPVSQPNEQTGGHTNDQDVQNQPNDDQSTTTDESTQNKESNPDSTGKDGEQPLADTPEEDNELSGGLKSGVQEPGGQQDNTQQGQDGLQKVGEPQDENHVDQEDKHDKEPLNTEKSEEQESQKGLENQDQETKQNQQGTSDQGQQGNSGKTGEDQANTETEQGNKNTETEEGSKDTSSTSTPNTSATSALTEAELSRVSTAVTGTLATAPVSLVGNVQAVAGSFFDAVGSNFSSAPSLLTDAGTVAPAVGSDAGKEFLGTPVSRDDLAPGYHVYFDYGYRNHTLKVSSANSKVKQHNFAVGFYAQDAGLNYGLALVKSNGTNTSTPTKARTWTEEVTKEGSAEKETVIKSSNYASRTKSNSTGLMGSVGLASNTDFVNFGAFVLFSNTKNYRSSVGFEDQYSSVDSRQYGFDLTYGYRLYKDNNSSVVVKAGLTDVYYTQDAFAESATSEAAKAEVLSFQKMSKNNVFLHLGVQGTYLARVNDYLFQTDAGLKLEQALTNNRFDFKLKDGTVVKGAAGDTFTARLVVGETLYVDNFSLRLGVEFATGNKTNARVDKLTATAAYKF